MTYTAQEYAETAHRANMEGKLLVEAGGKLSLQDPPGPGREDLAALARSQRDSLITATDYLMMPDYPLSGEERAELAAYRQALRDMPAQPGFPDAVLWPDRPVLSV